MAFRSDPGGVFESDEHRRVLAHLSRPEDDFGYTLTALFHRLLPDEHTDFRSEDDLKPILADLKRDDLLVVHDGDVLQQSQAGYDKLVGPIANEPGPDAKPERPADLGAPTPLG